MSVTAGGVKESTNIRSRIGTSAGEEAVSNIMERNTSMFHSCMRWRARGADEVSWGTHILINEVEAAVTRHERSDLFAVLD